MSVQRLEPGQRVSHPTYGFGVIEGVTTVKQTEGATEAYLVSISHGGTLTVPLDRADRLGLRPIVNGLSVIAACLAGPAGALPDNDRERVAELRARWLAPQSNSLAQAVRDLTLRGCTHRLTPGDKRWLDQACERLSGEAALVDSIDIYQARSAIQEQVERLKGCPS